MLQATFNGHEEVVDILLRKNADPNAKSYRMQVNPLINAATEGHDKVVARLLKVKGTNVNAMDLLGNTALMRGKFTFLSVLHVTFGTIRTYLQDTIHPCFGKATGKSFSSWSIL